MLHVYTLEPGEHVDVTLGNMRLAAMSVETSAAITVSVLGSFESTGPCVPIQVAGKTLDFKIPQSRVIVFDADTFTSISVVRIFRYPGTDEPAIFKFHLV